MLTQATLAVPRIRVPRPAWRLARAVSLAVIIAVGVNHLYWALSTWDLVDFGVYWDAALRIRAGEPLYQSDVHTFYAYRYAPWFAYAWVPFTYLPKLPVGIAWSLVMLAMSAWVVWPLLKWRTELSLLVGALMVPLLVPMASGGNVQPLLVAAVMYGLPRRSGPVWIALAASLKVVPILFALVYLGRGEWRRALLTAVLSALLIAPTFGLGFNEATVEFGNTVTLLGFSPVLYVAAAGASALAALWLSRTRTRYGPLAAGAAAMVALPRLHLSDLTLLLAGLTYLVNRPKPPALAESHDATPSASVAA